MKKYEKMSWVAVICLFSLALGLCVMLLAAAVESVLMLLVAFCLCMTGFVVSFLIKED